MLRNCAAPWRLATLLMHGANGRFEPVPEVACEVEKVTEPVLGQACFVTAGLFLNFMASNLF